MKIQILFFFTFLACLFGCSGTTDQDAKRHILVGSSVYAALLQELGAEGSVAGVLDGQFIVDTTLHQYLADGSWQDFGPFQSPNIEKILACGVDTLLLSYVEGHDYGPLSTIHIPIIECSDYLERTPLQRAMWIKRFGALVGKEALADSLFTSVKQRYDSLCSTRLNQRNHPTTLLTDLPQGDVWYTPADSSYLATLYRDAGYILPCSAGSTGAGSIALTVEQVISKGHEADIWFIKYAAPQDLTYKAILHQHPYASLFKAFRTHQVYGCNTLRIPYYEQAPFRPDLFLQDIITRQGLYFTPLNDE